MMDQRGVLNTRIHHVLRILLTAPRHRQPQTQPAGGYQTFPSATIGRSSEEFKTKVAGTRPWRSHRVLACRAPATRGRERSGRSRQL